MQINGYNFKVGADPEFFVKKFGKLLSAHSLIPGTKEAPFKVEKGAVQVDGMALEFNIDPADNEKQFETNMSTVLEQIKAMIPGYEMFVEPVADFGLEYIASQPKEARELGCTPDFNAYTGKVNPRPNADTPFRTASGHIHIGWHDEPVDVNDPGHFEACCMLAKAMDVYVGIPSLIWDEDDRRRQLYGQPGAFRPKSYGMEYRVLSNTWITSPLLRKVVYNQTIEAIKAVFKDNKVGETKFAGLTARDILMKTNTKPEGETQDWIIGANYAFRFGGVKSVKHYRELAA